MIQCQLPDWSNWEPVVEAHRSSQNHTESGAAFYRRPELSWAVKLRRVFPAKGRACENSQRQYSEEVSLGAAGT